MKQLTSANYLRDLPRGWRLLLVIALAGVGLFAFVGISRTQAQATVPVYFTGCASNTGNNATVLIPDTAPQMHTAGYFTPESGDEFAVFRPVGGTCKTFAASVCAGAMVWQGSSDALAVWGDNAQLGGVDGMLAGEAMCWRVWDASANDVYTATVVYNPDPPFISTGLYASDGLYMLQAMTPTAVELISFGEAEKVEWHIYLLAAVLPAVAAMIALRFRMWQRR